MKISLQELQSAAVDFAEEGGKSTLKYYKKSFDLEFKSDDTPVTNADRNAEKVIREKINKYYPEHGIIGEEFGTENEDADVVWVLDPIDGTQSFIHGIPFYTTLIGILVEGQPEVGVIYAPALDEMVAAATDLGCTLNGSEIEVRECKDLSKATFLSTDVTTYEEHGFQKPLESLLKSTRIHRTWGDAYGHMMVASGRADIMIDPILSIWDAAALLPVVSEAGGSFTDVHGEKTIETGNAITTNTTLAKKIIQLFDEES
ncbi:histidinol-phosphatase [Rhodohalobacter sulfatireducens]|uniref:Histidinol-phosphatase n=1 Tax=Rhodohalobacter sulfatireducens TaxID=2911366 RepID=A0ABS9KIH1_9BACT|nr:histidinol-phosphatase [Rhodohalobacter sulfatireducens]MCG2590587.1 histidinol-phosphatase [Rhodohalobacter sulfatireducens]